MCSGNQVDHLVDVKYIPIVLSNKNPRRELPDAGLTCACRLAPMLLAVRTVWDEKREKSFFRHIRPIMGWTPRSHFDNWQAPSTGHHSTRPMETDTAEQVPGWQSDNQQPLSAAHQSIHPMGIDMWRHPPNYPDL
jgi:hypothetical protein